MRRWVGALAGAVVLAGCGGALPSPEAPPSISPKAMHLGVTAVASLSGTDARGTVPLREVFDGSGSTADAEGASLSAFRWDFGDGSPPAEGVTAEHVYELPGDYVATLVVTDSYGRAGSTTLAVHADPQHGVVVALGPLPDADHALAPATVHLDASGSHSRDPAARIARCRWQFDDGSADAEGCAIDHVFALPGTWTAQVTVTDSDGDSAQASTTLAVTHDERPRWARYVGAQIQTFAAAPDGRIFAGLVGTPTGLEAVAADGKSLQWVVGLDRQPRQVSTRGGQLSVLADDTSAPFTSALLRYTLDGVATPPLLSPCECRIKQWAVDDQGSSALLLTDALDYRGRAGAAWSLPIGAGNSIDQVVFDPQGNLIVAGSEGWSTAWQLGTTQLQPGVFLAKLSPSGAVEWVHGLGSQLGSIRLGTSAAGTVVVSAQGYAFGWGASTSSAQWKWLLFTAEADGQPRWLRELPDALGTVKGMVVDPAGQVALLTTPPSAGSCGEHFGVLKYNLAGDALWSHDFAASDCSSWLTASGIDLAGHDVVVAGQLFGSVDFGLGQVLSGYSSFLLELEP